MYDTHINACWFQGAPQIWLNTDDDVAIFEDRWRAGANLLQFFTEPLAPAQQCSAQHHHLLYLALHTSECYTQYSGLLSFKYTVQEQEYKAVWAAVHGVQYKVTAGDSEVCGGHCIALDVMLSRWQPWTIPFPLLLLPLSTAAEILSQTMGNIISNVSVSQHHHRHAYDTVSDHLESLSTSVIEILTAGRLNGQCCGLYG